MATTLLKGFVLFFIQGYSPRSKILLLGLFLLYLSGCGSPSLPLEQLREAHLARQDIQTRSFQLMSLFRVQKEGGGLVVYIEGDGRSWANRAMPSSDPTPHTSIVIELILHDSAPNLAYLARPCQYVRDNPVCSDNGVWTNRRFAPDVISSINEAIDILVKNTKTMGVHLVGYSGGGAVAALIASQRKDVLTLRTIAGNLDTEALNRFHKVSPMPASLNPIDVAPRLRNIPQQHWVGLKDKTVPPFIADQFVKATGSSDRASIITVKNASHQEGWAEAWGKHSEFIRKNSPLNSAYGH